MSRTIFFVKLALASIIWTFSSSSAWTAEHCDDQYYIDRTLANGSKWDMCWSHSKNQGIRYHHIFYTPKHDSRRMVLFDASIAQIHVPYDDNAARFHDVSDFGLGDDGGSNNNLVNLNPAECPSGSLAYYNNKAVVCHRVINNGSAYRKGIVRKSAQLLKVFSVSKVGQYIYGIEWDFYNDGKIKPSIVATGALQRFSSTGGDSHGWIVNGRGKVGLAHMHNFYWRLDFDIDATGKNDIVQEVNHSLWQGKRYKELTDFSFESGRSVNPSTLRSWIIKDGSSTNLKGHSLSYEVRMSEVGQREAGPSFEPFTNHDFYVTRVKNCELFASHNASVNSCNTNNLSEFVSGESIVNQDIVIWVGVSFYHMPRSEDVPKMDAHVSGFELIPRDWHTTNPSLDNPPVISLRLSASDDFVTSASKTILIDVMANDTGQSITINTLDNPANGTAAIFNNKVQYTPDVGFIGADVFWYSIKDSLGGIYGTKITVTVTEAVIQNQNVSGGGSWSLSDVLALFFSLYIVRFGYFRKLHP